MALFYGRLRQETEYFVTIERLNLGQQSAQRLLKLAGYGLFLHDATQELRDETGRSL